VIRRVFLGAGLLVSAAIVVFAVTAPPSDMPGFDHVRDNWQPSESYLLDRNGALLHVRRVDFKVRRFGWVPIGGISPALLRSVVRAEDKNFWMHMGIDPSAIAAAAWNNLRGNRVRGASTITMQLAAMLLPSMRAANGRRSLQQKFRQAWAALVIEQHWTKNQILEAYLNLLGYRGELQGVAAASQLLLGKSPSGLTDDEGVLLAALLPAPNASLKRIKERACELGSRPPFAIACLRLSRMMDRVLSRHPKGVATIALAPHVASRLLDNPGTRVRTTLDRSIQAFVRDALRSQLRDLSHRNVRDGAAVVVDNASGEILAYVGSVGPNSRAPHVDGARASRQAGSTLKPFLYALAIERKYLTAASVLDDGPINLETVTGLYIPQNYDRDFRGLVSVRTALASSLNIPAVRALVITGVEPFRARLNRLGYRGIVQHGEYYGYALALGAPEVSLLEQVEAYRTLARKGIWSPLRLRHDEAVETGRRVIDAGSAFIIGNILSDRAARMPTFGPINNLETPFWSAVKTGTSKAMRDNWCIGYTDRYTVGVWVGNFEGDPMRGVSGVTGAAPVWREIVTFLHDDLVSRRPLPPNKLVSRDVTFRPPFEAPRKEWFLRGTETVNVTVAGDTDRRPEIISPPNGAVIALDPDIPSMNQLISIKLRNAHGLRLTLNNREIAASAGELRWAPSPGYHQLILWDAKMRPLDKVRFTVRGVR